MNGKKVQLHEVAENGNAYLLLDRNGDLVPITFIHFNKKTGLYEVQLLQNGDEPRVTVTGSQEVIQVSLGIYANRTSWHVRPH